MKQHLHAAVLAILIMVVIFSAQMFGQFRDEGIRVGVAGGINTALTKFNTNDMTGIGQIFVRHNIADYFDGDLSGSMGSVKGYKYESDLILAEYKVLYRPFTFDAWEPYFGLGLGLANYSPNKKISDSSSTGSALYLPIALGTEYALTDCIQLDVNANLSYAFSNKVVSTRYKPSEGGTGNDTWWGIKVGISYTIAGGGPSEAEKEAARVKAEQDSLHARELVMAEAKRVQDSINAVAAAAEAARMKEAELAEAKRIQDSTNAAAEAKRIQDSIDAVAAQQLAAKRHEVVKPEVVALKAEVGKALVLEGIAFESGKAVILKESEKTLFNVRKTFDDNPDMKVEIRGYTDNVGNAKKNIQLSQARAAAVKDWLVKHGIVAKRITAKGYGSKNPVGDNKTADGREKNRRIEFFRTK